MEGEPEPEATLFPATVGEKLRAAREAQGLELADVAARTRIPQRHLEAIEKSNYSQLPSITYALGFAKSYARAVGADEVTLGRELRGELSTGYERPSAVQPYEMTDPTRTPPRGLVWIGALVAVLVLAGVGLWYGTSLFRGSAPPPEALVVETPVPTPEPTGVPGTSGGQVTLIATETVWLRINDGNGNRIFEKEMQPGERYDVPMDADRPVARTGRADAIQVTINGSNVPPLGPPEQAIEVPVSADALRARAAAGEAPAAPLPATGNSIAP
jgi:transcriptional regulator with XRE-family HTH domain